MQKPIVFIVGPDMTGKTHIAKALVERLNIRGLDAKVAYYKAASEHEAFLSAKQDRFINDIRFACPARLDVLRQLLQQDVIGGIVYDRGYPCERVYSRFFQRPTDDDALMYLDDEYAKLGARIIVCSKHSFAGVKDDLDPNIDEHALQVLASGYDRFMSWTKCRSLKLYVDDWDLGRQVNDIMQFLNAP